jgi:hypothetical protein
MISLEPSRLPQRRQLSAPILTTKKATPSQKSVKKPWKGELAAEGFCRSKVEKECVKRRSVNLPLPLRREGVSWGWDGVERGVVGRLEGVEGLAVGVAVVVVLLVLVYGGWGEGMSGGGEARERVMEGGLVEPLACF